MKEQIVIVTILIAMTLVTGIGTVYADTLKLPTLSDKYVTGVDVQSKYQSDNRYQIVITVQYQVPSEIQVPETITVPNMDGTNYDLKVQKGFIEANNPVIVEEEVSEEISDEIRERLDEKRQEQEDKILELSKGINECWYGVDNFHAIQQNYAFETPEQFIQSIRHYEAERQILLLNSAHEVCRAMDNYQKWIPTYGNMEPVTEGSEQDPRTLDESDSTKTQPVTENDIKNEAKKAQEFKCSTIGKYRNLCDEGFSGTNRGDPEFYKEGLNINPAYKKMVTYLAENPNLDKDVQIIVAENISCQIAWDGVSQGSISPKWWRVMLLDGTCDVYIPELAVIREAALEANPQ